MQTRYYPIALKLKNRIAVVAGGGLVSERKIKILLKAGARVRVISPILTPALRRLVKCHRIIWLPKKIQAADIYPADIVISATSESGANKKVSLWARKRKVLVNVVDRARLSDFISPALLYMPKAIVAIYTEGKDPVLSRDLKNFLKERWDEFLSYRDRLQKG